MITVETEVELTGDQMAEEFWELTDVEQASFFNNNRFYYSGVNGIKQMDWFVELLDDNGRMFIRDLYLRIMGWEMENNESKNC